MAQRVEILLTDDLDGQQATQTVRFALDGRDLEIDLSDQNAAKLRMVFLPYISAGRRQGARPTSGADAGHELADVRAWARANGYEVSERGRVKQRVLDAYHAARAQRVSSKLT